jgi:hypothetical protein
MNNMLLDDKTLTKKLKMLAKAASEALDLEDEIYKHSREKYGCDPSEIDNDEFLDRCTGSGGVCSGMTAKEFNSSMTEAIRINKK